jgi:hypothetical protein
VVNKVTQTDFGYTGQRNLDAQDNQYSLGLMDYRAGFYSVSLGRFTQPDTIVPGAGNPQAEFGAPDQSILQGKYTTGGAASSVA